MAVTTKQELIKSAVSLITAYPQLPLIGSSSSGVYTSSAEDIYDNLLSSLMENFIYGFGIHTYTLTNPLSTEDVDTTIYSIPSDVGRVVFLTTATYAPKIQAIIGRTGLSRLVTFQYTILVDNKIQLIGTYDTEPLVIGYITKSPDVLVMSENFKLGLQYMIASRLALKFVQSRNIHFSLSMQGDYHIKMAQKYALDNRYSYGYLKTPLQDSVLNANTQGKTPIIPSTFNVSELLPRD